MVQATSNDQARPLIAHVVFRLGLGGLENGLVNLINHPLSRNYRHVIICITESGSFARRLTRSDVDIVEINKRPGKDFKSYARMWRVLRQLRPDLVHTRNANAIEYQPVAWLAGVPRRLHGEHGWDTHDLHGASKKYRLLRRVCAWFIHEFVAVSEQLADYLTRSVGISGQKVNTIRNGVDSDLFSPGPGAEVGATRRLCSDPGELLIGAVGRLQEVKNHIFLVRALARIRETDPTLSARIRLIIVGHGPLEGFLRAEIRSAGLQDQLELVGRSDDVPKVLNSIDVFVLPSVNEGMSNTLLEAMACGKPTIATNVGGSREIVVDGETGFLIEPGDVDALVSSIRAYAESPQLRDRHGAAGRQRILERFALDVMIGNYVQTYERMIGDVH